VCVCPLTSVAKIMCRWCWSAVWSWCSGCPGKWLRSHSSFYHSSRSSVKCTAISLRWTNLEFMQTAFIQRLNERVQTTLARANVVAEEVGLLWLFLSHKTTEHTQVLSSMRTVRSFANETREADRYHSKLKKVLQVNASTCYVYCGYLIINGVCKQIVFLI